MSPAKLSKTTIYAGVAQREGKDVHVLGYQNSAQSVGANAMLLPFPAALKMGPESIVDTREGGHFLTDLNAMVAAYNQTKGRDTFSRGIALNSSPQVFDSGSYTVVLAQDVQQIPEALQLVPERKQPKNVSADLLTAYGNLYTGWQVALCCWAGELTAEPLLWWYEPKDAERIHVPTMDAHDGRGPQRGSVMVDHTIVWGGGTMELKRVGRKWADDMPTTITSLLAPNFSGEIMTGQQRNGDSWIIGTELVRVPLV